MALDEALDVFLPGIQGPRTLALACGGTLRSFDAFLELSAGVFPQGAIRDLLARIGKEPLGRFTLVRRLGFLHGGLRLAKRSFYGSLLSFCSPIAAFLTGSVEPLPPLLEFGAAPGGLFFRQQ
jgi:hypothetical protein